MDPNYLKKTFLVSFIMATVFLISCKKEKPSLQIHVIDKATNASVSGVTVVAYKCGVFNCNLGTIDLFSGTTDNNGNCKVPEDSYNEATYVRVNKENYWSWDAGKSTSKTIIPAGWIRMRIVKNGNYSSQAQLSISIKSQSTFSGTPMGIIVSFRSPADTSILIKGFGGESNYIDWQLYDQSIITKSGAWQQPVPRLDTVKNITLNY